jgi:tRNA (cmo5U34)-methyltransferase
MSDSATAAFDAHASDYDALRRRLVPCFDAFYGAAVRALDTVPAKRVLDLGAGTGALSLRIAEAFPRAELVLVDGAPAMLERASAALGERATTVVADLRDPLPDGPFCAVVSALAIHHLDDDDKRDLIARAHDALAPGGVFINADQVLGPTPALDGRQLEWHRRASAALGASADEWEAALERMAHDRCATVEDQLAWLREAGFADVDCTFRDGRFAVLSGTRPRAA